MTVKNTRTPDICLRVDVPVCAFRPYESREYQDTHPVPPPSSVYGMLLSMCGVEREDKDRHSGIAMALAVEREPTRSRVFRKLRRGSDLEDIRPDYQDVLIDLKLWIWIATANDSADEPLVSCLRRALKNPHTISRSGGLSLGESSYLIDSVKKDQPAGDSVLQFLVPDSDGFYSLPVWIEHKSNQRRRDRFQIRAITVSEGLDVAWTDIQPAF